MIEFDRELHEAGENLEGHICASLIQATAWWVAAELIRRHPEELTVIETHPGGGTYDCLSVFRIDGEDPKPIVDMNLNGHITHHGWFEDGGGGDRFNWAETILVPDRREYVVLQIEGSERLHLPPSTPATTKSSVGPRTIAGFLSRSAVGQRRGSATPNGDPRPSWIALSGFQDTSGYGGGKRNDLFGAFPDVAEHSRTNGASGFGDAAYRYWFLLDRHDTPRVAVDITNGLAWSEGGSFDLLDEYQNAGRRLDPTINKVFPTVQ